ncbi:MAG TPA: DHH family phosphoesterase, partial [Chitinophagaceae bacterium]|nr:DHH family phosphoesterase [Chitinophagaceae bacterium]
MKKRWRLKDVHLQKASDLGQALKIHPRLCEILVQRGIETFDQAKAFFRPQLQHLHSPWLMKDMKKAVGRVAQAFDGSEKILVFGDYDVDGTTAVACMYHFLKQLHSNTEFYIPHRYREGYGVSKAGIDYAFEEGIKLIIALDCGIKSLELITYAKEL